VELGGVGTLASPWQEAEDSWDQDEGDATAQGVPTPLHTSPAPTGTILLFPD